MEWYRLNFKSVFEQLETSETGLTEEEVLKRLQKHGPNSIAIKDEIDKIKILLNQFKNPLIYILLIAAVVTVVLHEYTDASVILSVVVLNAVIGYFQEAKAEKSMNALKKMFLPLARVVRNGLEKEINTSEIVPGDIVLISSGGIIPADLRLFKTIELRVEESALTGESLPVEKNVEEIKEENLTSGDQKNMVFTGTLVVSGRGRGIVVETGSRTVLGQIAENVRDVESIKTPLQNKLERFAKHVGFVVIVFSSLLIAVGLTRGESLPELFIFVVAIAVSAIPEGLPIAVTVAMAIGVGKMAKRNAIVRKLPAVETLGSTTIICSDKTGTLTKNEMTVTNIYDGENDYKVEGGGYDPVGKILYNNSTIPVKILNKLRTTLRIGLLCNESKIFEEKGVFKVVGDPTEGALIVSAKKGGLNQLEEIEKHLPLSILPFESEHGYMATLHRDKEYNIVYVKGAPEKILEMCSSCHVNGTLQENDILQKAYLFAEEGLRVLAMAYKKIPSNIKELTRNDTESGFTFAGIQGMMDPPRTEVIRAIEESKSAGIRTVMITGDHAITAVSIAKKLGIATGDSQVISGREIDVLSENELLEKVKTVSVFARVSPLQKLLIVKQLLKHGEVVAVTGDGVNDAPALKMAHIGVAMGRTGTDVAKEASDIVLADDNFSTIVWAIEEGRVVYDNIKKVTFFLIATGFAELLAILGTVLLGIPIPFLATQILWLNLVTNGLQDVALAFEPAEEGVLKRKPRNPKEGIVSRLMIQRVLLTGVIMAVGTLYMFIERLTAGVPLEHARTTAITTMVFYQFYQVLNSRSETQSIFKMNMRKNPFLLISMVAALIAQMAFIYTPQLQFIFRTHPISFTGWLAILTITFPVLLIVEIDKWFRRRGK